jgi:mutator protein MutT
VSDDHLAVTAAVIVRAGCLLIARRGGGDRHAGRWELPGGKVRDGETLAACLERELEEELGIRAHAGETLCSVRFQGGSRPLELSALMVRSFEGEPVAREHAELAWVAPSEWARYDFLEPDVALLGRLARRWADLVREAGRGG